MYTYTYSCLTYSRGVQTQCFLDPLLRPALLVAAGVMSTCVYVTIHSGQLKDSNTVGRLKSTFVHLERGRSQLLCFGTSPQRK